MMPGSDLGPHNVHVSLSCSAESKRLEGTSQISMYLLIATDAEEETNLPEMVEMLWVDGSVGRTLEYQSKGRGFKSLSNRSFQTSTTRPYLA